MNEGYMMESNGGGLSHAGSAFGLFFRYVSGVFRLFTVSPATPAKRKGMVGVYSDSKRLSCSKRPKSRCGGSCFVWCRFVNIVIFGMIWYKISEKCGQPGFWEL